MSILRAGMALHEILHEDQGVQAITDNIFPMVAGSADLPYIAYRRVSLTRNPVKIGRAAESATYVLICYCETYPESVALAEAVTEALDGISGEAAGMTIRSCMLVDATEEVTADAYAQALTFEIKC